VLDNFALLSGHISTLNRLLSNDKMPAFRNFAVIPLAVAPGRDMELEVCCYSRLTLSAHVTSLCRAGFYELRQLRPLVQSMTAEAARTVAAAFIS